MLDAAIQELCEKNGHHEWRFAETYDIKCRGDDWGLNPHSFREQLHMGNCFPVDGTQPPIFKVIEALWEELTGPTPALFKKRRIMVVGPAVGESWQFPLESQCFLRQLSAEGYEIRGDRVQPIDPDAPAEFEDKTTLASAIREHSELKPIVLIQHIEESDDSAARGNWHAAAGEARSFFEGLVVNLAKAESARTATPIPNMPKPGQKRSSFGPARDFVHKKLHFISDQENATIKELYSLASVKGGHPGLTDEQSAIFVRRTSWLLGGYLLKKYSAWKEHGHRW